MPKISRRGDSGGSPLFVGLIVLALVFPGVLGAVGFGSALGGIYDQMVYLLEAVYELPLDEVLAFMHD